MIVTSNITNKKFFWIKIPRTGTYSFKKLFHTYNDKEDELHNHYSYINLCEQYEIKLPGISVVRNPIKRFISIIYYIEKRQPNTKSSIKDLWNSTESCIKFLNNSFYRNCFKKTTEFNELFIDSDTLKNFNAYRALFTTQTHLAYNPNVKIFKYENLDNFTDWIEKNLGYDTKKLIRINQSDYSKKLNVDFNSREFIETVENLYYDDFKVFNYPLQYLT